MGTPYSVPLQETPNGSLVLTDHFYRALSFALAGNLSYITIDTTNDHFQTLIDAAHPDTYDLYKLAGRYFVLGATKTTFDELYSVTTYPFAPNPDGTYGNGSDTYYAWYRTEGSGITIYEAPPYHVPPVYRNDINNITTAPIIPFEIGIVDLFEGTNPVGQPIVLDPLTEHKVTIAATTVDSTHTTIDTSAVTTLELKFSVKLASSTIAASTLQLASAAICDEMFMPLILMTFPIINLGMLQQVTLRFNLIFDSSSVNVIVE